MAPKITECEVGGVALLALEARIVLGEECSFLQGDLAIPGMPPETIFATVTFGRIEYHMSTGSPCTGLKILSRKKEKT